MSPPLPVRVAPCPACGGIAFRAAEALPGQLLPHRQRFQAVTCEDCGQRYLRERVDAEALDALYDEHYPLHRGPAGWGAFAPLVASADARREGRRVAALRREVDLAPGHRVLDLGCGRAGFLERLHEETGAEGLGVDAVAPERPEGTPWAARGRAPVRCVAGTLPDLPTEVEAAAPYRAATMWHALEHDPAPRRTLAWLRERLEPGGVLLLEVPDGAAPLARRLGPRWAGHHTPRHVSLFDPPSLRRLVASAGFEVRSHRRVGTLLPYTLVALTLADAIGFRFGRHPGWALFPAWALGLGLTWPWLGRPERQGLGLQLLVAQATRTATTDGHGSP